MIKLRTLVLLCLALILLMTPQLALTKSSQAAHEHDKALRYPIPPAEKPIPKVDFGIMHDESKWTTNNTHDGAIIKVADSYYVFSTDYMVAGEAKPGIQIRTSQDLVNWRFAGRVFPSVSEEASQWTNGGQLYWAPYPVERSGTFYLYYSVSQLGTRNSYIGLATSTSIEGPWTDQGAVFKTKDGDSYSVNAIDPAIITDKDGGLWMVYGSYFGGMYLTQLDPATGKLLTPGDEGVLLAQRKDNGYGIEGPEILYNPQTKYYYLTVSYGWLENTYNVRVGRSKSITGPYVDYNGKSMIDTSPLSADTGTKIVGAYGFAGDSGWLGTGHNGLLKDANDYYLIHNARVGHDIYWSHLHVRKLLWTEDGWPVVSPERYAGEGTEKKAQPDQLTGQWEQIILPRTDDSKRTSTYLTLLADGKINDSKGEHRWELTGLNTLKLYWYAPGTAPGDYWVDTLKVITAWDWELWRPTLVFTGLNQDGTAIWGKLLPDMTDEEMVAAAERDLTLGDLSEVRTDLRLPTLGARGTEISWQSDQPEVISAEGKVTRPPYGSGDASVQLTATIVKGEATAMRSFLAVVKQHGSPVIAEYRFSQDNGAQAHDTSGNELHGTVFGSALWQAEGKSGGALRLNGTDGYVQLPNQVTDAREFTFTSWVNWQGGGSWQRILDFGAGNSSFMFLTPSEGSGKLRFTIHKNGTDQNLIDSTALPVGQWTHVAVTMTGTTGRLYVNGVLKATNTNMTFTPQDIASTESYIGRSRFPDPFFNGLLDEFMLYRYAMTSDQIYEAAHPAP